MAKKVKENEKDNIKKDKNKKVDNKKDRKKKKDIKNVEPKKKTIKKSKVKSYADNTKFEMSGQIKQIIVTTLIVLCVLGIFYLIAFKKTGHTFFNHNKDEEEEVTFQDSEILLGTSFDMGNDYLVVYYDLNNQEDTDVSKINEEVTNFTYMGGIKIYKCDISSAFSKPFVTEGDPNTNPESADQILLNGPTVIRFTDGSVSNYVTGADEIVNYLKDLRSN